LETNKVFRCRPGGLRYKGVAGRNAGATNIATEVAPTTGDRSVSATVFWPRRGGTTVAQGKDAGGVTQPWEGGALKINFPPRRGGIILSRPAGAAGDL